MQRPSYDFSRNALTNSAPDSKLISTSDDALTGEAWLSSTRSSLVNESDLGPSEAAWLPFPPRSSGPPRMANTSDDAGASWLSSPRSSYSFVPQSLMNARDLAPPSSFRPPRMVSESDLAPSGVAWISSSGSFGPSRMVNASYRSPSGAAWISSPHGSFGPQRMMNTSSYAPRHSAPGFAAPSHSAPRSAAPGHSAPRSAAPGHSAPRSAAPHPAGRQEMGNEGSPSPWYKTKLCPHWKTNSCWFGGNCTFAHGDSDLRLAAPRPARHQEMGNEGSPPPWYKTTLCPHWKTNSCWFGGNCNFAHGKSDRRY